MNPLIQVKKASPLIAVLLTRFAQRLASLLRMTNLRLAVVAGFCGLLLGCPPGVTPNAGEKTPPTISVTVLDLLKSPDLVQTVLQPGQLYQFDPTFSIYIMVNASDPGGMKTMNGGVDFFSTSCGSPDNVRNGYWASIDGIDQVATVSPQNTVDPTLYYWHGVKTADVQALPCGSPPPQNSSGIGTIYLYLVATNQSNISTPLTQYYIRIGNGALPPH